MKSLFQIIADTYSEQAARLFRDHKPTQVELMDITDIGKDVLQYFSSKPGACGAMSAMFAARWEMKPRSPLYVVAGELYVNEVRVYGHDTLQFSIQEEINSSNPSWDGHFWIVFGPYVVDVSIFRTAYSDYSPPALKRFVLREFGTGRGLLIADSSAVEAMGFRYIPHAVLTKEQVTAYVYGAKTLLDR